MSNKLLNNTYLSMLCTELAMLIDAGLTANDSIQVIQKESSKEAKTVLKTVSQTLQSGRVLAVATMHLHKCKNCGEPADCPKEKILKCLNEHYQMLCDFALS